MLETKQIEASNENLYINEQKELSILEPNKTKLSPIKFIKSRRVRKGMAALEVVIMLAIGLLILIAIIAIATYFIKKAQTNLDKVDTDQQNITIKPPG